VKALLYWCGEIWSEGCFCVGISSKTRAEKSIAKCDTSCVATDFCVNKGGLGLGWQGCGGGSRLHGFHFNFTSVSLRCHIDFD
jgi:hypothetical protein